LPQGVEALDAVRRLVVHLFVVGGKHVVAFRVARLEDRGHRATVGDGDVGDVGQVGCEGLVAVARGRVRRIDRVARLRRGVNVVAEGARRGAVRVARSYFRAARISRQVEPAEGRLGRRVQRVREAAHDLSEGVAVGLREERRRRVGERKLIATRHRAAAEGATRQGGRGVGGVTRLHRQLCARRAPEAAGAGHPRRAAVEDLARSVCGRDGLDRVLDVGAEGAAPAVLRPAALLERRQADAAKNCARLRVHDVVPHDAFVLRRG
jgi:hypothetical protein